MGARGRRGEGGRVGSFHVLRCGSWFHFYLSNHLPEEGEVGEGWEGVCSLFYGVVPVSLSSLAIILLRKEGEREAKGGGLFLVFVCFVNPILA